MTPPISSTFLISCLLRSLLLQRRSGRRRPHPGRLTDWLRVSRTLVAGRLQPEPDGRHDGRLRAFPGVGELSKARWPSHQVLPGDRASADIDLIQQSLEARFALGFEDEDRLLLRQQELVPGEGRLGRIKWGPLTGELAGAITCALLERDDESRPPRADQTQLGDAFDEL